MEFVWIISFDLIEISCLYLQSPNLLSNLQIKVQTYCPKKVHPLSSSIFSSPPPPKLRKNPPSSPFSGLLHPPPPKKLKLCSVSHESLNPKLKPKFVSPPPKRFLLGEEDSFDTGMTLLPAGGVGDATCFDSLCFRSATLKEIASLVWSL